jgi:hypothetical protein
MRVRSRIIMGISGAAAVRGSESGYGYSRWCDLYREARLSRWLSFATKFALTLGQTA